MKKFSIVCMILTALLLCGCTVSSPTDSGSNSASKSAEIAEVKKIEVIDVSGMSYADAVKTLSDKGFTNVTSNADNSVAEDKWKVVEQSIKVGEKILPDQELVLTCKYDCQLYLDITSEYNLLLNKYDIAITLDGEEVGIVSNGDEFTSLVTVLNGSHTLVFCKNGDISPKTSKDIDVTGDMTFSCEASHDGSAIGLKNVNIANDTSSSSLEVIDVTGMVLSEAISKLTEIGFSNIKEEPYSDIWIKDNWVVINQGIAPGTSVDKNEYFQLDCEKLDAYFSDLFNGKTVSEVEEIALSTGTTVQYEGTSWNDLTAKVAAMEDTEKADWVVTKAEQGSGAGKTAKVIIKYTGVVEVEPEPTETVKPTNEPTPTSAPKNTASYHSSGNKTEAKKGASGVYAYKKSGRNSYDIYLIIDFDEGYVYKFCVGNEDAYGDKIKITVGDLNSSLVFTYHYDNESQKNRAYFRFANQPDHLIYDDGSTEYDFTTTDLDKAIKLRDNLTMIEY